MLPPPPTTNRPSISQSCRPASFKTPAVFSAWIWATERSGITRSGCSKAPTMNALAFMVIGPRFVPQPAASVNLAPGRVTRSIVEGELLWEPSEALKTQSVIADYMRWLAERRGLHFADYEELWRWSIADLETFWTTVVEFFDIQFQQPAQRVLADRSMPGARWFEGARINYAENVFRQASADRPALVYQSET